MSPPPPDAPTLLLLPGLGANGRLYDPQRPALLAAGVRVVTPDYPRPTPGEPIGDYAVRFGRHLADALDLRRPVYVGGLSFGACVAAEMAGREALGPGGVAGVLMVSGCMAGGQIAPLFRAVERASQATPDAWADRLLDGPVPFALSLWQGLAGPMPRVLRAVAADCDVPTLKWAGHAMTRWPGPPPMPPGVAVRSVHGDADAVIPLAGVAADPRCGVEHVVPGGRHLLNLTHPETVSAFLLRCVGREGSAGARGAEVRGAGVRRAPVSRASWGDAR